MEKQYSIGETAKRTGLSVKQLRYWTKKYIKCEKIICGRISYRYFTESQIWMILAIKKYLDMGFHLGAAVKYGLEEYEKKEVKHK